MLNGNLLYNDPLDVDGRKNKNKIKIMEHAVDVVGVDVEDVDADVAGRVDNVIGEVGEVIENSNLEKSDVDREVDCLGLYIILCCF